MAAPTRTLYTASKHAITGFFRALRMEVRSKGIHICHVMPASVKTDFRSSAVDVTDPAKADSSKTQSKSAMSPEKCASLILQAAAMLEEEVYLPRYYQLAVWIGVLFPGLIEYFAAKKYK